MLLGFLGKWNCIKCQLHIQTSIWVLCTPNTSRNMLFSHQKKKKTMCDEIFLFLLTPTILKYIFFMLVASFSGFYCSITHLHYYQCQPASPMNIQQLFFCGYAATLPRSKQSKVLFAATLQQSENLEINTLYFNERLE